VCSARGLKGREGAANLVMLSLALPAPSVAPVPLAAFVVAEGMVKKGSSQNLKVRIGKSQSIEIFPNTISPKAQDVLKLAGLNGGIEVWGSP
jgi:hypothetical protein